MQQNPSQEMGTPQAAAPVAVSNKGFVPTVLLCLLFGWLGIHRFYVGKIGTGVLMLITFGGFGVWAFIDLIMVIVGSFTDAEGRVIKPGT